MKNVILATIISIAICFFMACDMLNPYTTVQEPIISLDSGTYTQDQTVSIECNTVNTVIYYSTDGSLPGKESNIYSEPITVDRSLTLKAIAILNNQVESFVTSKDYYLKVSIPTSSIEEGAYDTGQILYLNSETENVTFFYTLDGSVPTMDSEKYINDILVNQTITIRCFGMKDGYEKSSELSVSYTISPIQVPSFDLESGLYNNDQTVSISCSTEDAVIYYTLNEDIPTTNSNEYFEPITVNKSLTIKAIATRNNTPDSAIAEASYVFQSASPSISPSAGTYDIGQTISLNTETTDATIFYTLDGSDPSDTSTLYRGPFMIEDTMTIKSIVIKTKYEVSDIISSSFVINPVDVPLVTPETGTYNDDMLFKMSCSTSDTSIYYTLNGDTPTNNSRLYTGSFYISEPTTVKAIAIRANTPDSDIVEQIITFQAAMPTVNPEEGHYTESKTIIFQCDTSNSSIYYSLDGSDPLNTGSLYTVPIVIDYTTQLRAISVRDTFINSTELVRDYTITAKPSFSISFASPEDENLNLTLSTDNFISKSEHSNVELAVTDQYDSYYWYIGINLQTEETASTFNWDVSSINPGLYTITCFATIDGISISKEVKLKIIN